MKFESAAHISLDFVGNLCIRFDRDRPPDHREMTLQGSSLLALLSIFAGLGIVYPVLMLRDLRRIQREDAAKSAAYHKQMREWFPDLPR